MGKERIVIDTNNLISALGWRGKSRELMERVIAGEFELYISVKQLEEIKRVLNYPRLDFTLDQKRRLLEILESVAKIIDTEIVLDVADDRFDNMLLECAVEVNARFLISGDDDLRRIREL